jgi:hypothetical protein
MRRRSRATTFEGERVALLKCTVTGQWAEFTSDRDRNGVQSDLTFDNF